MGSDILFMILQPNMHGTNTEDQQAFREFLVSTALISNLNIHKSVGLSHVKFKILTYFCDVIHLFTLVRQPGSYTLHGKLKFFFRWILYHWDLYNAYPADNKSVSLS